eukprot:2724176-Amphidinium_carterae.1
MSAAISAQALRLDPKTLHHLPQAEKAAALQLEVMGCRASAALGPNGDASQNRDAPTITRTLMLSPQLPRQEQQHQQQPQQRRKPTTRQKVHIAHLTSSGSFLSEVAEEPEGDGEHR